MPFPRALVQILSKRQRMWRGENENELNSFDSVVFGGIHFQLGKGIANARGTSKNMECKYRFTNIIII